MTSTPASSAFSAAFAAADLGATSGRVVVGRVGRENLDLTEVHRFPNTPVRLPGGLHWDILGLHQGVLDGLREASRQGRITSVGVDSWAVDYGLLDADGALLGNPHHYRDARTEGVPEQVWATLPAARLYRITGLQHLVFNTVYQLAAARGSAQLAAARTLLLVPDLLTHWLTGTVGAEFTNASTTGLLDAATGRWSQPILDGLGIDRHGAAAARAVHQNLDVAQRRQRRIANPQGGVRLHDVGGDDGGARSTRRDDLFGEAVEKRPAPRDGGDHRPFGGKRPGNRAADAHARAGDQRLSSPELQVHVPSRGRGAPQKNGPPG